jgi:hypothetical protein
MALIIKLLLFVFIEMNNPPLTICKGFKLQAPERNSVVANFATTAAETYPIFKKGQRGVGFLKSATECCTFANEDSVSKDFLPTVAKFTTVQSEGSDDNA